MSFVQREIDVTITLGAGNFGDAAGSNTLTLTGLWVSASIQKGALPGFDLADVRIWGMTPDQMNTVSRLGKPLTLVRNNTISISAGDAVNGMGVVFQGVIQEASQDFKDAPQTALNIGAQAGGLSTMVPVAPTTIKGSASVATLFQTLAGQMTPPVSFENNGVSSSIGNVYLSGTAAQQATELAQAANPPIYCHLDSENGVLAIWPKSGNRGGQIPLISPTSGMVGPPTFADVGIGVKSIYFPGIKVGGQVQVMSNVIPAASKTWRVMSLSYDLDTSPGGAWFMDMTCNFQGPDGVPV